MNNMGATVAVLLAKERHIVSAFERIGAVTRERARTPAEVGVDAQRFAWRRLRDRAIVRDAGDGRYYLDVEVWEANRRLRRRMIVVLLAVVLLAAAIPALLTLRRS
jgi:actin-like ATPase involved in cell morphogenesis